MKTHAHVVGWGKYVPQRMLTNDDLAQMVDTSDGWIRTRTGIVERRSTDSLAVEHPQVVVALRFIHDHAHEPICTMDVVRHAAMSRSGLEKAFREHYVRAPMEEVRYVRLVRAEKMLLETDEKIVTIARRTGFQTPHNLCRTFQQQLGMPAGVFARRQPSLDHAGVVQHQQIVRTQQRREVSEAAMFDARISAQCQQTALVTLAGGYAGDQRLRQVVVEVRKALRCGEGVNHGFTDQARSARLYRLGG